MRRQHQAKKEVVEKAAAQRTRSMRRQPRKEEKSMRWRQQTKRALTAENRFDGTSAK